MIVESLWKNIKHRDLAQFNRPRLDLVTHLVVANVLPRALRTLSYIRGLRRIGRPQPLAEWQTDFRADWRDMSKSDEHRRMEKELKWLNAPTNAKGRAERLAEMAEEENRLSGEYATDVQRWTCSCPSYLISRFLLCKHLVRLVNKKLNDEPITDLSFFLKLRRNHRPPYYIIPNVNETITNHDTTSAGAFRDVREKQHVASNMGSMDSKSNGIESDSSVAGHEQRDKFDEEGGGEVAQPNTLSKSNNNPERVR
jgi:hypothetical protein